MGGRLHLFESNTRPAENTGMGQIYRWEWDGLKIPVNTVADDLNSQAPNLLKAIREEHRNHSPANRVRHQRF